MHTSRSGSRLVAALSIAAGLFVAFGAMPTSASSETLDECIRRKVAAGTDRALAVTQCMGTTSSVVPVPGSNTASTSSDDGTSIGALLAAGAVGALLGAAALGFLRRSKGAPATAATPAAPAAPAGPAGFPVPGALAGMAPPGMAPPGMAPPGMPAAAASPAPDPRADTLIQALIDLGDRVTSAALRAEILAALASAGVQALEPPPGTPFDANRMRGVGSAPAPAPAHVGTVAATDRVGYQSGARVLRLPDVIVHVAQ